MKYSSFGQWISRAWLAFIDESQQCGNYHEIAALFFFPSRASVALARSSHIVVLIERITHMHALVSLFGGSKVELKQNQLEVLSICTKKQSKTNQKTHKQNTKQNRQTTPTKQNKKTKTKTKTTKASKQKHTDKTAPKDHRSKCAGELNDLAHERKQNNRPQSKILQRCPAKHMTSSAETQDPPCQDPGDRAEEPSRHKTPSQRDIAMQ